MEPARSTVGAGVRHPHEKGVAKTYATVAAGVVEPVRSRVKAGIRPGSGRDQASIREVVAKSYAIAGAGDVGPTYKGADFTSYMCQLGFLLDQCCFADRTWLLQVLLSQ